MEMIRREEGFSLVESVVALALLLTVLIPTGAFVLRYSQVRENDRYRHALVLGRRHMENAVMMVAQDGDPEQHVVEGPWEVHVRSARRGRLYRISVRVVHARRSDPYLVLTTLRP